MKLTCAKRKITTIKLWNTFVPTARFAFATNVERQFIIIIIRGIYVRRLKKEELK